MAALAKALGGESLARGYDAIRVPGRGDHEMDMIRSNVQCVDDPALVPCERVDHLLDRCSRFWLQRNGVRSLDSSRVRSEQIVRRDAAWADAVSVVIGRAARVTGEPGAVGSPCQEERERVGHGRTIPSCGLAYKPRTQ
jgi:hypothetical protein